MIIPKLRRLNRFLKTFKTNLFGRINRINKMLKYNDKYKIGMLILLSVFLITSCSVRSVQIKKAEQRYKKGQMHLAKGNEEKAIVNFNKSIKIARSADYKEGVAHNLNELAIIHTTRGEYVEARELLTEMIKIYKDLNSEPEVSKAMNNMAMTYVREKKFQEAFKWFDDLMEWDKKTNNELGVGITFYNMALIYNQHLRNKEKAKECFFKALKIFKETGNEEYIERIKKRGKK